MSTHVSCKTSHAQDTERVGDPAVLGQLNLVNELLVNNGHLGPADGGVDDITLLELGVLGCQDAADGGRSHLLANGHWRQVGSNVCNGVDELAAMAQAGCTRTEAATYRSTILSWQGPETCTAPRRGPRHP
jgi:hypothetical protein